MKKPSILAKINRFVVLFVCHFLAGVYEWAAQKNPNQPNNYYAFDFSKGSQRYFAYIKPIKEGRLNPFDKISHLESIIEAVVINGSFMGRTFTDNDPERFTQIDTQLTQYDVKFVRLYTADGGAVYLIHNSEVPKLPVDEQGPYLPVTTEMGYSIYPITHIPALESTKVKSAEEIKDEIEFLEGILAANSDTDPKELVARYNGAITAFRWVLKMEQKKGDI